MPFQAEPGVIRWRMHFASPPARVYAALATDPGRAAYWAEAAPEVDGVVTFHILNYAPWAGRILKRVVPSQVDASIHWEMVAGWVSVLMAMKAAVDHGVDLRNHDPARSWSDGYADN